MSYAVMVASLERPSSAIEIGECLMAKGTTDKLVFRAAIALFFIVVSLLLLSTNMQKEMSHDEHMYVAGGYLLSNNFILLYKDYPYLQMPNLALAYAAIFQATDHLLL